MESQSSLNGTWQELFLHNPVERGSDYWERRDGRKVTFSGVEFSSFFALSGLLSDEKVLSRLFDMDTYTEVC